LQGLAFVDFEDEVAAAAALLKTDGMKLKVSQPPLFSRKMK
jgi:hypothetical protein